MSDVMRDVARVLAADRVAKRAGDSALDDTAGQGDDDMTRMSDCLTCRHLSVTTRSYRPGDVQTESECAKGHQPRWFGPRWCDDREYGWKCMCDEWTGKDAKGDEV